MEPELTYTYFADAARNNSFNREQLQKGFNNIEQSDPIFADLFTDIDLYSNRLGAGDQKQSDTVASLIKEIDKADLLNSDAVVLLRYRFHFYNFLIYASSAFFRSTPYLTFTKSPSATPTAVRTMFITITWDGCIFAAAVRIV